MVFDLFVKIPLVRRGDLAAAGFSKTLRKDDRN